KILDFGLAQFAQGCRAASGLTPERAVLGTPAYLAPEQARDPRTADARADLYSLGCTLYHLLTGRPPFPPRSVLQLLLDHQGRRPRPLSDFRGDLPEGLERVVDRLLAKDPARRFQSAAEVAEALTPYAAGDTPAAAVLGGGAGESLPGPAEAPARGA